MADVDVMARRIRSKATKAVRAKAGPTAQEYLDSRGDRSHPFLGEMQLLPVADSVATVAHSLMVTERAIDELVAAVDATPDELLFVGSRIIELGTHELDDPAEKTGARVHLASAKKLGYFFTPPQVSLLMARELVQGRDHIESVLDPACGAGALLGAVLIEAHRAKIQVDRLVGVELDDFTASLADRLLTELASRLDRNVEIEVSVKDGIEYLHQLRDTTLRPDAIILNPPYGRVKFLKDRFSNIETLASGSHELLKLEAADRRDAALSQSMDLRGVAAIHGLDTGAQDLYRLFLGLSFDALADGGRMSAITPSGWMGDKHATKLRSKLIRSGCLRQLELLPENMRLFHTVNQETVILITGPAASAREASFVQLTTHDKSGNVESGEIDIHMIERTDPKLMRIPRVRQREFALFERLLAGPNIGNVAFLKNARGELDLTQDRNLLQSPAGVHVVRGDEIERYRFVQGGAGSLSLSETTYANEILPRVKGSDTRRQRLACRQVSYLKKPRRLSWALVPEGHILANSCNYVSIDPTIIDEADRVLCGLLVVLNSAVAEWFFRVFNSNNHVANYEIDSLPVPPLEHLQGVLAVIGDHLNAYYASMKSSDSSRPGPLEDFADALVARCLGLTDVETGWVLKDLEPARATRIVALHNALKVEDAAALLKGSGWFQHKFPSLSALDLQMIGHVPQGGNWQQIPESVPSARLNQIREMTKERGVVRTTYYGRLRPDQPAYTIATYFNRPGNGTNIHPWEDRTITAREAARLQSFPDWYLFAGGEGAVRTQIGNAVPPRLAYAIGRHLREYASGNLAVDLYAGAGGLSCGLELSGWDVAAAIDNNSAAARTYRLNQPIPSTVFSRPAGRMIEADLLKPDDRRRALDEILSALGGKKPDAIFGGPPCQGFSTAGWRQEHDSRNDLAAIFLDFVRDLDPVLVVLENVEGLLNYRKGKVLAELLAVFAELGYKTPQRPWLLAAERYGVPQMRRRVFLVGHKEHQIDEPPPIFDRCLGRREQPGQLELTGSLPYPVTTGEALIGLPALSPHTHPSMGAREIREDFGQWLSGPYT